MGLPVLTVRGEAFAGRVAASLLHAAGLEELATDSLAGYEAKALELARDPAKCKALKDRLAQASFDIGRFTQGLEAAYTIMSDRRGAPPQGFSV
jgi:predicted O-linked N-acetylglucosamine transferase (SPINDLY family)